MPQRITKAAISPDSPQPLPSQSQESRTANSTLLSRSAATSPMGARGGPDDDAVGKRSERGAAQRGIPLPCPGQATAQAVRLCHLISNGITRAVRVKSQRV